MSTKTLAEVVLEYFMEHPRGHVTDLYKKVQLPIAQMRALLRADGTSAVKIRTRAKIAVAKELIARGDHFLYVAQRVGYASHNELCSVFKANGEPSPSTFRRSA